MQYWVEMDNKLSLCNIFIVRRYKDPVFKTLSNNYHRNIFAKIISGFAWYHIIVNLIHIERTCQIIMN